LHDFNTIAQPLVSEDHRISRIETLWSIVRRAQGGGTLDVHSAQKQMLDRYGGAVRRYLLGAVRDADVADELYQEFALRFLNGDYASADAEKGRFRSFLKTILFRLVAEHHRRKKRNAAIPFGTQMPEPVDDTPASDEDPFTDAWSEELLKQAWEALKQEEQTTGRPLFTIMRTKVENPDWRSQQLAETVSFQLGRDISTANARVMLHRARERFGDLLLDEVADSVDSSDIERLEEELIVLGLIEYCRPALERRRDGSTEE
jgi:RNA polymerase sigma-70 factor (ECF subfamily)